MGPVTQSAGRAQYNRTSKGLRIVPGMEEEFQHVTYFY